MTDVANANHSLVHTSHAGLAMTTKVAALKTTMATKTVAAAKHSVSLAAYTKAVAAKSHAKPPDTIKIAKGGVGSDFLSKEPKDNCSSWTLKVPPFGGVTQTHCTSGKKSLETCIGVPHVYEDCSKVTTYPDGSKTYTDITHAGPITNTHTWDMAPPKPVGSKLGFTNVGDIGFNGPKGSLNIFTGC